MATKVVAESDEVILTQHQPAPKPEPKPKLPDVEIAERKEQVAKAGDIAAESLFSEKPKKKEEAAPVVPATPEPTPAPEVKPAPAPKKKPAPAPQPTADENAERAARRVVDELAPEPEDVPEAPELTPEDQRHYEIFKAMADGDKKYAKLADEFVAFAKKRYDYEKAWLQENPGKEFDPAAEEHEEFFKKQPAFDEEDYEDARVTLKARKIVRDEIKQHLDPIEQRQQAERIQREVEPQLRLAAFTDTVEAAKGIAPELVALCVDKNGNPDYSPANLARAEEADPIAADVLGIAIKAQLMPLLDTVHRAFTPNIGFALNPKIQAHARIIDEVRFFEESMTSAPDEIKTRAGKAFITIADWSKMVAQINSSRVSAATKEAKVKVLDAKYWTIGIGDLKSVITGAIIKDAKAEIEKRKRIASKQFGKPASAAIAPLPEIKPKPALPKPSQTPEKPAPPPSLSGGSEVNAALPSGGGEKNLAEKITAGLFPG